MTGELLSIGIAMLAVGVAVFAVYRGTKSSASDTRTAAMQSQLTTLGDTVAQQLRVITETVDRRMRDTTTQMDRRLDQTAQTVAQLQDIVHRQLAQGAQQLDRRLEHTTQSFAQITELLAKMEATNQRMVEVGKDVASLQNILTAPKLRGGFGELMLGDLLASILPAEHFTLQYRFRNGEIVDALITLRDDARISVDAKFPLENFRRVMATEDDEAVRTRARRAFVSDIKKHVQAIAKKYIVPEEGTLEFALMYIPAENVYYETIVADKDGHALLEYFFKHRVIPVSPNSFYAYLMTIVFGLRGLQIEKTAREMIGALDLLSRQHARFAEEFETLGKHLGNAQKRYEDAHRRFSRIEDRVARITQRHDTSLPSES